jgi:type I restriction enzyme, S subunit
MLNSNDANNQKSYMGQGSSVFHIYTSSLKTLKIPIPSVIDQTRIAHILSDMDTEIEQLETQLAKYRQLKVGMMQELLTGKKRLI